MRKKISDIYSKAFPKESGEEYTAKELIFILGGWVMVIAILFMVFKFVFEKFHWFNT